LQIEYALVTRGPEQHILPVTREFGMSITAYGVLSRGLLAGSVPSRGDMRAFLPRFKGANGEQNRKFVEALAQFAQELGKTQTQVAIAWVLAQGKDLLPTMGARTRKQLEETLGAVDVVLTPEQLQTLEAIAAEAPIAGTRYDEGQMKALDSEKIVA
jgi:aryl-alcohol dehydrogenase-like predicted oxidoreductase